MHRNKDTNPYRPPASDIIENNHIADGTIGLFTGIVFNLTLALPTTAIAALLNPDKIDKIALLLLASLAPQLIIVISAWWWAVHGQAIKLARFFFAVSFQALLVTISIIGSILLIVWIDGGPSPSLSKNDITPTIVLYCISFILSLVLGLIVRFRARRATNLRLYAQDG